ncbi:MAG: 2-amino-4-hydroxy-6-hydroxymethyldihydropteridine diphosphokinase [Cyanobacteria bacterium P01_G01_bin.19]
MARCAIALGSNQGNSLDILTRSLATLDQIPGIILNATSSWYSTKAVETPQPQPDYLNGCALLSASQTPEELLNILQATEIQFGRTSKGELQPRTLDLDLLLYEDLVLDTPDLTIPHPRMSDRAFVLVPLAEIAPDWIEPKSKLKIATLLGNVNTSGVKPYIVA